MTARDADALEEKGDMAGAIAKLHEPLAIAPEMVELRIMTGVTMASAGDLDGGCALIAEAVRKNARWGETLHPFAAGDLLKPEGVPATAARPASPPPPHPASPRSRKLKRQP